MSESMADMDEDGYPTEAAEEKIRAWPWADLTGLFAFVKSLWAYPEYWSETDEGPGVRIYQISTAGWSGNEQLIAALQSNTMAWSLAWYSSRRGGHYEFKIDPTGGSLFVL